MEKIISSGEFVNHPKFQGVYLKHFFSSADNDRLNNMEVKIDPGCQISPHQHDDSTEFFYVLEGEGEFLIDGKWSPVKKGYALVAPLGEQHGFKNSKDVPLMLFSTFSPSIR